MKLAEALTKLKEGDEVEVTQSDLEGKLKGVVGEIKPEKFYVWQNEKCGREGLKSPESRGKKYSWNVYRSDLFVQEPKKSFRNAGVTDSSDMLTEDGQKVFLSWLLSKNQDAFKAEVVDKIIEMSDKKED